MPAQTLHSPLQIIDQLVNGNRRDREEVIALLAAKPEFLPRGETERRLVEALRTRFAPQPEQHWTIPSVRMWLLGALLRLAEGEDAKNLIRMHLDPEYEPDRWCRYWTLAGLYEIRATDIASLAQKTVSTDQATLVVMLARAVLAANGEPAHQLELIRALGSREETDDRWAALRALRIVPVHGTASLLCDIVEQTKSNEDWVYDAVVALGKLPIDPLSAQDVERAARTLASKVGEVRRWPTWDTIRMAALRSLGNLRVASVYPTFLNDLRDDNPGVVREAALGIEAVLGTRIATSRIVEVAAAALSGHLPDYALALRWMDRAAVAEELDRIIFSGQPEAQETARVLLSEIGGSAALQKLRSRREASERYLGSLEAAEERVRELFESSIVYARSGFSMATFMDGTVFFVGVGLIVASAVLALIRQGDLSQWAGAGVAGGATLGLAGTLYSLLVGRPRDRVKGTVNHLMHMQLIFLGYLRQLHQIDQAFTRRLLEDEPITISELDAFAIALSKVVTESAARVPADAVPIPVNRSDVEH